MNVILRSVKRQDAIDSIDDIFVLLKTKEEHLKHIDEVLLLLKNDGVTIKLKKCFYFSMTIDYFGRVIDPDRLQVTQKKTKEINLPQYTTAVSEMRLFPSLWNVYCQFLPNLARLVSLLNKKLKTTHPDIPEWTTQNAMRWSYSSKISSPNLS